jgi:universal stress protein A
MPKLSPASRRGETGATFRQILVPTDLTDRSTAALDVALKLAAAAGPGSRVTVLHVIETVPGLEFAELKPFYEKLHRRARKKLGPLVRRAGPGTAQVDVLVAYGRRAETIVKTATSRKADLIVLASHRVNPAFVGRDWGTLSYKVGLLAQCPVLLVK